MISTSTSSPSPNQYLRDQNASAGQNQNNAQAQTGAQDQVQTADTISRPPGTPQRSRPNESPGSASASRTSSRSGGAARQPDTQSIATEMVMVNDVNAASDRFEDSMHNGQSNLSNGKDATDDMISAAQAYNDMQTQMEAQAPSTEQTDRIARLKNSLDNAKDSDTLESIEKQAKVDLPALNKSRSRDDYGKYGKLASSYTRSALFSEARYNNSKVLQGTPLGRFQRPGKSVIDPIGANGRLGVLLGTRANAALSSFSKAGSQFMSGIQKMKEGKDPTDDFVGASASVGQGVTELSAGAMTDYGNHLVKLRAAQAAKQKPAASAAAGRPEPAPQSAGAGGAQGKPGPSGSSPSQGTQGTSAATQTPSPAQASTSALDQQVADKLDALNKDADTEVASRQNELQEEVIKRVEGKNPDVKQLELQDAVNDVRDEYIAMKKLGDDIKLSAKEVAQDAHENLQRIDSEGQIATRKLEDLGYKTQDEARASSNPEAVKLADRLDELSKLKRTTYDQFNSAMAGRETALKSAAPAFKQLGDIMKTPDQNTRASKLAEWSDAYGKKFEKYQNSLLAKTDSLPEWFKISRPLRAQGVPSAINTAFGAAGLGAAIDNYMKKKAAGTLTPEDKLNLAAQVFNLVSGPMGFVPVVGPLLGLATATIGATLGGLADQYKGWQNDEAVGKFQEAAREEYNKRHPDQQIAYPFIAD